MTNRSVKRPIATGNAVVIVLAVLASAAMAKEARHLKQAPVQAQSPVSQPSGRPIIGAGSGNAAMDGNNGNSAQGSNAASNVKGGDSGVGR